MTPAEELKQKIQAEYAKVLAEKEEDDKYWNDLEADVIEVLRDAGVESEIILEKSLSGNVTFSVEGVELQPQVYRASNGELKFSATGPIQQWIAENVARVQFASYVENERTARLARNQVQ